MRIQKITTQPNFTGKVYTASNLMIRDLEKLEKGASKINAFAQTRNCDFVICRGAEKGLSVLAKKLDTKVKSVDTAIQRIRKKALKLKNKLGE